MAEMVDSKNWHDLISRPQYHVEIEEDVWVEMRDGVRLCVDVYRPQAQGRFPALVSWSWYGKNSQKLPTNPVYLPSDYVRGTGGHECGEQDYFVSRGYVHVIPDIRGVGASSGEFTMDWGQDGYDLIEWVARQPWCNGKVGMTGMSAFSIAQYQIAAQHPPHLIAIFPFEGRTDAYRHNAYHGGILSYYFQLHIWNLVPVRQKPVPASFKEFSSEELQDKVRDLRNNPSIQCTPFLYLITECPQMNPSLFDFMLHPHDGPYYQRISPYTRFKDIKIPTYQGSRWNAWAIHLPGAFDAYEGIATPKEDKKLLLIPSDNYGGLDRPFHEIQEICLRWYDYWLKGIDTKIMDEPPILIYVQGVDNWRYENEWPLEVTQWTKFFLRENGCLSTMTPGVNEKPQTFTSEPWANPTEGFGRSDVTAKADPIPRAIYETKPLSEALEVTGPVALYWHASIESEGVQAKTWKTSEAGVLEPEANDTNWYLKLKDIDTDGSERCIAEGWLRASHYELDVQKSKPYAPYHPHSRSLTIKPDQVVLYASDLRMTSNVFLAGHRIRLEIAGQDQMQAIWFHLPHMARVKHTIYSSADRPSHLLLPLIPKGYKGAGEPQYPPTGPFRIPKFRKEV